jgi:hypothetical protein
MSMSRETSSSTGVGITRNALCRFGKTWRERGRNVGKAIRITLKSGESAEVVIKRTEKVPENIGVQSSTIVHGPAVINVVRSR